MKTSTVARREHDDRPPALARREHDDRPPAQPNVNSMYSFGPGPDQQQGGEQMQVQGLQAGQQQQRRTVSGQMIQRAVARQQMSAQMQNQLHMLPIEQGGGNQLAEAVSGEREGGRTKAKLRSAPPGLLPWKTFATGSLVLIGVW